MPKPANDNADLDIAINDSPGDKYVSMAGWGFQIILDNP
jgi:hypothetical protein